MSAHTMSMYCVLYRAAMIHTYIDTFIYWFVSLMWLQDTYSLQCDAGHMIRSWNNGIRCMSFYILTVSFPPNTHNRHPIARPQGRALGCLLWVQALTNVLPWSLQRCMRLSCSIAQCYNGTPLYLHCLYLNTDEYIFIFWFVSWMWPHDTYSLFAMPIFEYRWLHLFRQSLQTLNSISRA